MQAFKNIVAFCTPIMAGIAFMLSVLNTPILMGFYLEPDLIVKGGGSDLNSEVLVGTFEISNEGRVSAKNVEVGVTVQEDQRISLLPNIDAQIIEQKDSHFVKNVRIKISNLAAGEKVIVLAISGPNNEKLNPEIAQFLLESGVTEVPFISYVKSDSGLGKNLTKSFNFPDSKAQKPNKKINKD